MKLSVAKLRTGRRCLQLYKLTYVDKLEPVKKSEALNFGSLLHAGLNAWWSPKHASGEERLAAALEALRAYWSENFRSLDAWAGVTAEELLKAYHARWDAEMGVSVRPVGVEVDFESAIPDADGTASEFNHWRSGRMDLVVQIMEFGAWHHAIGEHKTTSEDIAPGAPYWTKLRVDTQVSEYLRGGSARFGVELRHVFYDVLVKPDITPYRATPPDKRKYTKGKPCKKHAVEVACANCDGSGWKEKPRLQARQHERDEHPEEWRARLVTWLAANLSQVFARMVIPRLDHELIEADLDAAQTGDIIALCEKAQRWPKNDQACMAFGRPCDFRDVCLGVASVTDPNRFRTRTYGNAPQEDMNDGHDFSTVPDPDADGGGESVSDPDDGGGADWDSDPEAE